MSPAMELAADESPRAVRLLRLRRDSEGDRIDAVKICAVALRAARETDERIVAERADRCDAQRRAYLLEEEHRLILRVFGPGIYLAVGIIRSRVPAPLEQLYKGGIAEVAGPRTGVNEFRRGRGAHPAEKILRAHPRLEHVFSAA